MSNDPRLERLQAQIDGLLNCMANDQQKIVELKAEISRLKEGNFTSEEFQNLCHNLSISDMDKQAFFRGCAEYQKKLFGESAEERQRQEIGRALSFDRLKNR